MTIMHVRDFGQYFYLPGLCPAFTFTLRGVFTMIKLERTSVMNLENAIRGARNPMNSWGRMDSYYDEDGNFVLGENDLGLAQKLRRAGSDHRKYVRQIFVSVDITAPLYW